MPEDKIVTILPVTVATDGLLLLNEACKPELAEADSPNAGLFTNFSGNASNVTS